MFLSFAIEVRLLDAEVSIDMVEHDHYIRVYQPVSLRSKIFPADRRSLDDINRQTRVLGWKSLSPSHVLCLLY